MKYRIFYKYPGKEGCVDKGVMTLKKATELVEREDEEAYQEAASTGGGLERYHYYAVNVGTGEIDYVYADDAGWVEGDVV